MSLQNPGDAHGETITAPLRENGGFWDVYVPHEPRRSAYHAACRSVGPELFFLVGTQGAALVQVATARSVCRPCRVESDCLR